MDETDLVYRLRKRAEIRRQIAGRKSVQEGKPDRISDLLEEAAAEITELRSINVTKNVLSLLTELEINGLVLMGPTVADATLYPALQLSWEKLSSEYNAIRMLTVGYK